MNQQAVLAEPVLEFAERGYFIRNVFIRIGTHPELRLGVVFWINCPEGYRMAIVTGRQRLSINHIKAEFVELAGYNSEKRLEQLRQVPGPSYAELTEDSTVTIVVTMPFSPASP